VLEVLGARIDLGPLAATRALEEIGFTFLNARIFHPAMRHVARARADLGIRTLFNWLGPVSNPARATHQLLGVADRVSAALLVTAREGLPNDPEWGSSPIVPAAPIAIIGLAQGGQDDDRRHSENPSSYGDVGSAGDSPGQFGGYARQAVDGPAPGGGDAQASVIPAGGGDAEGDPVHRLRADGRGLPAAGTQFDNPLARLTLVVGFAALIAAVVAFIFGAEKVAFLFQWLRYREASP
jgi:hypothetical protein